MIQNPQPLPESTMYALGIPRAEQSLCWCWVKEALSIRAGSCSGRGQALDAHSKVRSQWRLDFSGTKFASRPLLLQRPQDLLAASKSP